MILETGTIEKIQTLINWNFDSTKEKRAGNNSDEPRFLYRGVNSLDYKLIPKISRRKDSFGIGSYPEVKKRYANLKQYLKTFMSSYELNYSSSLEDKDWVELFHAQHYGVPTPLLDFSRNPLVGLYFASQDDTSDGVVYAVQIKERGSHKTCLVGEIKKSPYYKKKLSTFFVDPPHENSRIRAQHSVFGFFPISELNKSLDMYEDITIHKFLVPQKAKPTLIDELHKVGINDHTLFPDLNGFGKYLTWKIFKRFPG